MGRRAVFALVLCGCSLDEGGLVPPPQPGVDAAIDVSADASAESTVDSPPPPPGPCSTPPGTCVASIPQGWTLIAFDAQGATTCPSSYAAHATVSNPQPQAGACDCSCAVTASPACDVGTLQRYISADTSCNQAGVSLAVNGPGCTAWPNNSGPLSSHSKGTPLAPSGGTCAGTAVVNKSAVTTTHGNACLPPTNCAEDVCNGKGPSGFATCIEGSGAQACPSGWGTALVAGDGVDLACSACSCDLNGTTCTNASLTIFGDMQCNTALVTLPVDGQCDPDSASGKNPVAFTYKATLGTVCNATGPKTATVTLTNQKTICCKP